MSRPTDWHEVFGIKDPTPGEVHTIRQVAHKWGGIADAAEYAETKLKGWLRDDAVSTWIGKAGEAFAAHTSDLPGQLGKAKSSYRQASEAMTWWAGRLESHQYDADRALVQGRAAKQDLASAHQALSAAHGQVSTASGAGALTYTGPAAHAPKPEDVTKATNALHSAQAAEGHAQGLVNDAQGRLDAARRLAQQAGSLRESDGRTTSDKIHHAADAGIKPRSWWEKFKDGVAEAWHVIVAIAKIVVMVLGVVALIIGGPLAWIVFAAALIVLADTLMKYFKGEATLLDVALAALSCIPGTKGLTTLGELSAAFKAGGALGAAAHLMGAAKTMLVGLAKAIPEIGRSANLLRQGLVPGLKAMVAVLGRDGAFAVPELRATLSDALDAFKTSINDGSSLVKEARGWQGSGAFPGRDVYAPDYLPKGTSLEVGFPGVSNYASPAGTAAAADHQAAQVWEGLQVGPHGIDAPFAPGYRPSMVELHLNEGMTVASGHTLANPQYGAGGTMQHFFDIKGAIANGHVSVLDHTGNPIHMPPGVQPGEVNTVINNALHGHGTISLDHPTHINLGVADQEQIGHYNFNIPDGAFASRSDVLHVLQQSGSLVGTFGSYAG